MDAVGMGWRVMMEDFWQLWLVGLVAMLIPGAINFVGNLIGMIPFVGILGSCIAIAVAIFVQPAFSAGVFYAVRRRIDGNATQVNDVFEGFRQRYWQSVVAVLPPTGVGIVAGLVIAAIVAAVLLLGFGVSGNHMNDDKTIAAILVSLAVAAPLIIALILVMMLFTFSFLAVWDHPESGWEAVKDSVRVVKAHYLSVLGFALLFAAIGIGAALLGILALCIGLLVTGPAVSIWWHATAIYLYRSWTGRPLTELSQAPFAAPAAPLIGPGLLPPTV
jgi:hypothetical protein